MLFRSVTILTDAADYDAFLAELEQTGGASTLPFRRAMAAKAYAATAAYDAAISQWFARVDQQHHFPPVLASAHRLVTTLRYGENPHQSAALYVPRNPDTPGLPRLENVLKAFPKLPLIGHAAGFWASISGDATFEDFGRYPEVPKKVTDGGALDRLMKKYPNLYGDLSEPGGERALTRDPAFARDFLIRNANQLLFGTDVLMPAQKIPQFDLLDSFNLPEEVQYKI